MSNTLYTYPGNFRGYKGLIAAQYSGQKVTVDESFKLGETNKASDFLKLFPAGKVPALKTTSGEGIFESNAIASYLANEQLLGKTQVEKAQVQQWMWFAENEVLPSICQWSFAVLGVKPAGKNQIDQAINNLKNVLSICNDFLNTKTYFVGERITLADICLACNMMLGFQHCMDPEFRKPFGNVERWFTTMINQPEVLKVIGKTTLCSKVAEVGGGDQKGKKAKKETPKREEKKQEKKPKEEKVDDDDEEKPAPKPKDPFALMPTGSFIMDEWKRTYSNNDFKTVALPYFKEHFDKEHYSIWYCEYKYPEELNLIFMTANLVGGFFQRLEKMQKHAFASVMISGKDKDNQISGLWIWRGTGLAFELDDNLQIDYESYTWKKLEFGDASTQKMIEQYFGDDSTATYAGKSYNKVKIFK